MKLDMLILGVPFTAWDLHNNLTKRNLMDKSGTGTMCKGFKSKEINLFSSITLLMIKIEINKQKRISQNVEPILGSKRRIDMCIDSLKWKL